MNLFDLGGKVAIVTGSSKGIGRSIAAQMARHGAKVVISSRKAGPCEEVAADINRQGGTAIAVPANISEQAHLEHLVAETRRQLGPVDIVVCNAASNPHYGPMMGLPDDMFDKIMRNNILSSLWLVKLALPDMQARKDGAVILISSIAGIKGSQTLGAYGVSKAADMALVRNLAIELGKDNIRVNAIAPGLIKTDFAKPLWDSKENADYFLGSQAIKRLAEPDDIGGIAVMLAAPAGRFVTGQVIVADGGATIT
ncbi:MAG: SDR family NAD(P)-dependent oxidoreductase [Reyranellaceae bacterium]